MGVIRDWGVVLTGAIKKSRAGIYIRKLLEDFKGMRVTDGYAAYSNKALVGKHQLCWAHLFRTIHGLRHNKNLPKEQADFVIKWYVDFVEIYAKLEDRLDAPTNSSTRVENKAELEAELAELLNKSPPETGEPKKLTNFRKQLLKAAEADKLFVCLIVYGPCDNNRAERDLRPFVIKRQNSFGSVSMKGATALATVMTVCANTQRNHPDNYFEALAKLG